MLGAHAHHAGLPSDLAAIAPRYGDERLNARGLALLRMCARLGLHFRSGAYHDGALPTYGSGPHRTTVDHIIASAPDGVAPASPTPCYTLYGDPAHPGLSGINSDHCPVIMNPPGRAPRTAARRSKTTRWHVSRLADPEVRRDYQAAVAQRARDSRLMSIAETAPSGDQDAVDACATEALDILEGAAEATVGVKTVIHGVTKPFMTEKLRTAWERRRVAYRVCLAHPEPGAVPERILHQCTATSQREWRAARAQHRRRLKSMQGFVVIRQ